MKFVRWLVAFITITLITQVAGAWVLDGSLLRADFILQQAHSAGFYQQVHDVLPHFLRQNSDPTIRQNVPILEAVITPLYIERKTGSYVRQLEDRYRDDGPPPIIDLTDLNALAARQGFHLPSDFTKNLKLGEPIAPSKVKPFFANLKLVKFAGAAAALVMLGITLVVAEPGRRLLRLSRTFGWSAFWLLPNWLVFRALPDVAAGFLNNNRDLAAIVPALSTLLKGVFNAVADRYLIPAAGLAALAVLTFATHYVAKIVFRPKKAAKPKSKKDEGGMVAQS